MDNFLRINKTIIYPLILFIFISIFGVNFFLSLLGNIILLLFLIPVLLLILMLISINTYKSKINTCQNCGVISFSADGTCTNCGADLSSINLENQVRQNPSESTIDVKAEEVK